MKGINNPPGSEEANSMHETLDFNHDRRVTEEDFASLAVKHLCNIGMNMQSSRVGSGSSYR